MGRWTISSTNELWQACCTNNTTSAIFNDWYTTTTIACDHKLASRAWSLAALVSWSLAMQPFSIGGLAVVAFWRSPHGPLGSGLPRAGYSQRRKRKEKGERAALIFLPRPVWEPSPPLPFSINNCSLCWKNWLIFHTVQLIVMHYNL